MNKKLKNGAMTVFPKGIIGCIHVLPLPGSPRYEGNMNRIIKKAIDEAKIYSKFPLAGIIVENMHDVPYNRGFAAPETISAMSVVCSEIRSVTKLPLGIQILAGAAIESLAVAVACDFQFLRMEGFSFAHVADEGIIQSCAAKLLRKRSELRANHIKIFADIKKKHSSHAITADISIGNTAHTCEFMNADGVIVTGGFTGEAPSIKDVKEAEENTKLPVIIGSGITAENYHIYKNNADAFIVGSYFKKGGYWKNALDEERIKKIFEAIR